MSTALRIELDSFYNEAAILAPSGWQSAVSGEAEAVAQQTLEVDKTLWDSQALYGDKSNVLSDLGATATECSYENWDGDDAEPLDSWAVRTAERFIQLLPEGVPMPAVVPECDGSVGLEWFKSQRRVFVVSIGSGIRLAYAWIDGTDSGHAVFRFDGETIPRRILNDIKA